MQEAGIDIPDWPVGGRQKLDRSTNVGGAPALERGVLQELLILRPREVGTMLQVDDTVPPGDETVRVTLAAYEQRRTETQMSSRTAFRPLSSPFKK